MSTQIAVIKGHKSGGDTSTLYATSFYGGVKYGKSLQITLHGSSAEYTCLTVEQVKQLHNLLGRWLSGESLPEVED